MSLTNHLTTIAVSLFLLLITVQLVRKNRLREEYALLWLVMSGIIVVLTLTPGAIRTLGDLFDVGYGPTLVLSLGLFLTIVILLSHSVIITTLADHRRDLAQTVSILEWKVRQLETNVPGESASQPAQPPAGKPAADLGHASGPLIEHDAVSNGHKPEEANGKTILTT